MVMMILLHGNHLGASNITMIVHLRLLETQHCRDFHNLLHNNILHSSKNSTLGFRLVILTFAYKWQLLVIIGNVAWKKCSLDVENVHFIRQIMLTASTLKCISFVFQAFWRRPLLSWYLIFRLTHCFHSIPKVFIPWDIQQLFSSAEYKHHWFHTFVRSSSGNPETIGRKSK